MLNSAEKQTKYEEVSKEIIAVTDGENDQIALMASTAALLHTHFAHFIWTGFYRVSNNERDDLIVGPYQGNLGCLHIPIGKGVCGTAAAKRQTVIVDDVHAFPGHITCDARAASEIVVPVFSKNNALIGVLDIDAAETNTFDNVDKEALESIISGVFQS
ncbi:MAG: GAF domain-containing protein [Pseudomonadota bacterium]